MILIEILQSNCCSQTMTSVWKEATIAMNRPTAQTPMARTIVHVDKDMRVMDSPAVILMNVPQEQMIVWERICVRTYKAATSVYVNMEFFAIQRQENVKVAYF